MESKDIKKFTSIIYGLAEEFGGTISKSGIDLKFDALKKYLIEDIVNAASWIVNNREEKYPPVPTVKEIISVIEKINGKINSKTNAEFQVDIIFKYFNHYGSYCDHVFKDPITNYLMTNRWSFRQIGLMQESELKWFRKSFVEAYTDMENNEKNIIGYSGEKGVIPAANLKLLVNK